MDFFSKNLQIFKKVGLPLFVLVVLASNMDQFLNLQVEAALRNPDGAENTIYAYGLLSLLSNILFPVLLTLTALFAIGSTGSWSLGDFVKKNLNQVLIETLRAWGKTLLWSLLLILPGLWRFLEFTFVPFVVTASSKYQNGEEDALQASARIVRRHFFKVLGVLLFFHLFIPLMLAAFFDAYRLIWKTPVASLMLNLLDTYLLLLSVQILFSIFKNEVDHVAHVQLEGN